MIQGRGQAVKARDFDSRTAGSNPAGPATLRLCDWSRRDAERARPGCLSPAVERWAYTFILPSEGRFDSGLALQTGLLLSWSERPAHNRVVLGSSPRRPTSPGTLPGHSLLPDRAAATNAARSYMPESLNRQSSGPENRGRKACGFESHFRRHPALAARGTSLYMRYLHLSTGGAGIVN